MFNSPKRKFLLIILYVCVLFIGGLFVNSALKSDDIKIEERKDENESKDVGEAKVNVVIQLPNRIITQNYRLTTDDTVIDLLERLRDSEIITYERTEYSYGSELDQINNIFPVNGKKWKVFEDTTDITNNIRTTFLKDVTTYTIRQE